MKRSRSLSNIPMPVCNVKRDSFKPAMKRSKSTLRSSGDPSLDGQTPLAHRLVTPTTSSYRSGQKYRQQKLTITPSSYCGLKRSGSVSSFGSRVSLTKNRSPLEKKSMQKLLNDKKWVAEQYSKVQTFIQASGLFNPELSGMIRPPTITTVVELFSVLFRQLIKTYPINSQSYADVVLKTLKLLNYPGSITLSTLKTANTMHGWPHFISIISWLIERVNLSSVNIIFSEQQDDELKQMFNLQDSVWEFLTTQHIYTVGGTPDLDLLKDGEEKLYEDMSEFTGTDLEALKNLEQPIKILQDEVAELETNLEEITKEIQIIEAQNTERQNIITKFKESYDPKEQTLDLELSHLRTLLLKQTEYKKILVSSVKQLEKVVASQSCRYNEKAKILSQIEDFKRAIGRKERKLTEYRVVKYQLDFELDTMVKEIESKVDAWNVSITKTLLSEMQNLRLREKGFHLGFIEELREVLKEKEVLTKRFLQEYKEISADVEKMRKRRSLENNNKSLNATRQKLDRLRNYIQSLKEENRKLLLNIDEVKKQFDTDTIEEEHLRNMNIKETETKLADLNNRIQKLTEKIDKSAKKGLGALVEVHNMATHTMQTIDEVMHSMLKEVTDKTEQSLHKLMDTYNYLLSIQVKSTESEFNNENKENVDNN